jgi:hypothetical protein
MESGRMSWVDAEVIAQVLTNEEAVAGFEAIAPGLAENFTDVRHEPSKPIPEEVRHHTLGALN